MSPTASTRSGIRLAELMAALSLATDLGMGQPMEFALSSCILGVRLAETCGYSEEALREVNRSSKWSVHGHAAYRQDWQHYRDRDLPPREQPHCRVLGQH